MSTTPIIEVDALSKHYQISHRLQRNTHPTLKDELVRLARTPLAWLDASGGVDREEFWALKDLSFTVNEGDVVGVMGRNGSGKSTLFKILSRVTKPTAGNAILRGRVASLLEVGTGFHPELSGRENVYFNGSILGMSKREIDSKFDEIVAFSEVERFLDTPVKFYSSGMKVRLAFSVAAHLDSDILLIDEVLAVGDVSFKQKCIDRMKQVAGEGRTILFVSHIIHQIEQICTRGIVLENGQLVFDGELDDAVSKYFELNKLDEAGQQDARADDKGRQADVMSGELVCQLPDIQIGVDDSGMPQLTLEAKILNMAGKDFERLWFDVYLLNRFGGKLALLNNELINKELTIRKSESEKHVRITAHNLQLAPDTYALGIDLRSAVDPSVHYHRADHIADIAIPNYEFHGLNPAKHSRKLPPVLVQFDFDF